MFVDSHCHLDRLKLSHHDGDLNRPLEQARAAGVEAMLCVGIQLEHYEDVLRIARNNDDIYASVGVHPSENEGEEPSVERLVALADDPKIVAIGETGLDYYYGNDTQAQQQSRFAAHLKASSITKKPTIIHTRDAREDTLAIMREHADTTVGGVMHCFTETWEMAEQAMELNFLISFSGIVTFKNAEALREVAEKTPLENMLIETDSPYLAPVPYRGKSNEPAYVVEVAKKIAELKGVSVETVAKVTSENFYRLFKIPKRVSN